MQDMRTAEDFRVCSDRLKSLGEPSRLRIVTRLSKGPLTVSKLAEELGMGIAKVSHHLKILRDGGILRKEQRGKYVTYSIDRDVMDGGAINLGCCRLELPQTVSRGL